MDVQAPSENHGELRGSWEATVQNLEALPNALNLSKQAMLKIKQNLAWAFGYNLIALPIAAGLLLPSSGLLLSPPLAALLMALSSISVVLNALSLKSK